MSRTGPGLNYGIPRRLLIRGMLRTTSEPFLPSGWSDGPLQVYSIANRQSSTPDNIN